MALICYEPSQRFALADDPGHLDEEPSEKIPTQNHQPVVLNEWCSYYLKWYDEKPDFIDHLPSSPFAGRHKWSSQIREINFNNYVGLARLGPVQVRVKNRKIGDKRFHALLDNVADHYADLIFGFKEEPVGHGYRRDGSPGRNLLYVEYLFLRRYLRTEDIEGIVAAILGNPHDKLLRETRSVPLPMAKATDPITLLNSLCRGDHLTLLEDGHHLCATPLGQVILQRSGEPLFPSEVPEERRYQTFDTHENRFAKHVLENLEHRLDSMNLVVQQHSGGLLNPEIGSDLEELKRKVSGSLDDPFWHEVGPMRFVPASSPVLHRREGYRQLFQLHALMQLLTRYDYKNTPFNFENLLETKDTATLYEYWCFFQVKEIMDAHFERLGTELLVNTDDLLQKMAPGICISYESGLTLCYNWSAGGTPSLKSIDTTLTGHSWGKSSSSEKIPDIVIAHHDHYLVLDAKNKGQFYGGGENGRIGTPNRDDLIKMHAYRDAITGVTGAFALFPGARNRLYPTHGAIHPWEGIGALALRPDTAGRPENKHARNLEKLICGFLESVSEFDEIQ